MSEHTFTAGDVVRAMFKPGTYSPNNPMWIYGLAWGFALPVVVIFCHLFLSAQALTAEYFFPVALHPLIFALGLVHTLLCGAVLGAFGSLLMTSGKGYESAISFYRQEARIDELTRIYNRRYFMEALERELARTSRSRQDLCLIFFDLDNFKELNDREGHLEGDKALKRLAKLLATLTRGYDTVARWGGDEFVVVLPDTAAPHALEFAERVRGRFSEIWQMEGQSAIPLTLSAGVATWEPGDTVDAITQRSDQSLYEAKAQGGNCSRLYPLLSSML